jgi:citrate synthase
LTRFVDVEWRVVRGDLYLTAEAAAAELGVEVRTLYTYVSRKQIRTRQEPGRKKKLYWAEDILRLRGEGRSMAPGLPSDVLVERTALTAITADGPFFRGQSAIALAETWTVEEVAALLWDSPSAFSAPAPIIPKPIQAMRQSLAHLSVADQVISLFPSLEEANPKSYDLSPPGFVRTASDVVRTYAAILGKADQPGDAPIHEYLAQSLGVGPDYADLIRRVLVMGADHELDPTTYAVRAVANTGATPYYAAIVGLSAFRGRRLQFGRSELVQRLIEDICSAPDAADPVVRSFRHGDPMLGFGSIVYGDRDPRAEALFEAVKTRLHGDRDLPKLSRAIEVGRELTGKGPSFTLMIAFIRHKLGLPAPDVSFMAAGRIVGWCAHAMEQFHTRDLVRPRSTYVGLLPGSAMQEPPRPEA